MRLFLDPLPLSPCPLVYALCLFLHRCPVNKFFPGSSDGKVSAYKAQDTGLIPGSGGSPEEENGNLFQYSCLENLIDGGAW